VQGKTMVQKDGKVVSPLGVEQFYFLWIIFARCKGLFSAEVFFNTCHMISGQYITFNGD